MGFALVVALAWAVVRTRLNGSPLPALARASLVMIGFNWMLHGFWGGEQFLYSQHWHVPLLVLLAALVSAGERRWKHTAAALALCVAAVSVNNAVVLGRVIALLSGG